jgi:mRNA-degrading endonuclease toxin of MazEF toxin-antitoxin module
VWWAELDEPGGAESGFRRPVVVVHVSQIVIVDGAIVTERVGRLSLAKLEIVLSGIDTVLGR